ncbi:MAG TPA: hypothetical protein VHA56_10410 [Mucilaginibacter sp.]|nr:hypothetical protein [Mucilaginibacter sp.]
MYGNLKKPVDIYVISSTVDPADKLLSDKYDFVKSCISKPIKLEILIELHSFYQGDKLAAS